jgi:hypothetical protein
MKRECRLSGQKIGIRKFCTLCFCGFIALFRQASWSLILSSDENVMVNHSGVLARKS